MRRSGQAKWPMSALQCIEYIEQDEKSKMICIHEYGLTTTLLDPGHAAHSSAPRCVKATLRFFFGCSPFVSLALPVLLPISDVPDSLTPRPMPRLIPPALLALALLSLPLLPPRTFHVYPSTSSLGVGRIGSVVELAEEGGANNGRLSD